MPEPRTDGSAIALKNGLVLVIGGYNNNTSGALASCLLYDPAQGSWATTGSLNVGRCRFELSMLENGNIFVAGGLIDPSAPTTGTTEIYDYRNGTWSFGPDLSSPRQNFALCTLDEGRIVISGGMNSNSPVEYLGSIDVYDPKTNSVSSLPDMPDAAYAHNMFYSSAAEGLLISGGWYTGLGGTGVRTTPFYSIPDDNWSFPNQLEILQTNETDQAVQLPNQNILLLSGRSGSYTTTPIIEEFDVAKRKWSTIGQFSQKHWQSMSFRVHEDTMIVIAGVTDPGTYSQVVSKTSLFAYNTKRTWNGPEMFDARFRYAGCMRNIQPSEAACELERTIYIFGGIGSSGEILSSCERLQIGLFDEPAQLVISPDRLDISSECASIDTVIHIDILRCGSAELVKAESLTPGYDLLLDRSLPIDISGGDIQLTVSLTGGNTLQKGLIRLTFMSAGEEIVHYIHLTNSSKPAKSLAISTPVTLVGDACDPTEDTLVFQNINCYSLIVESITKLGKDAQQFEVVLPKLADTLYANEQLKVPISVSGLEGSYETKLQIVYEIGGVKYDTTITVSAVISGGNATKARTLIADRINLPSQADFELPLSVLSPTIEQVSGYRIVLEYNKDIIELQGLVFDGTFTPVSAFDLTYLANGASIFVPATVRFDGTKPLISFRFRPFVNENRCCTVYLRSISLSPDDPKFTTCVLSANLDSATVCFGDACGDANLRRLMSLKEESIGGIIRVGDELMIDHTAASSVTFELYDMLGRLASTARADGNAARMNVAGVGEGAYVLRMVTPGTVRSRLIKIQR